jgi:hypothetical protein
VRLTNRVFYNPSSFIDTEELTLAFFVFRVKQQCKDTVMFVGSVANVVLSSSVRRCIFIFQGATAMIISHLACSTWQQVIEEAYHGRREAVRESKKAIMMYIRLSCRMDGDGDDDDDDNGVQVSSRN